jgi:hypothetical protein
MTHQFLGTSSTAASRIPRARLTTVAIACAFIIGTGALGPLARGARADTSTVTLGPNIVANGGFEQGASPGETLIMPTGISPLLGSWAVSGNVKVYGTAWQAEEGGRSLGLARSTYAGSIPAGVKQTLTTTVGQKYRVVFYQAGNPFDDQPSTIHLQIGGYGKDFTFQADKNASSRHMEWVRRSVDYTATAASTVLSLAATYSPGNDPCGLDNVQVRAIQPAAGTTGTPASSVTTLAVGSPAVAAGGSETLTVSAAPGAALVTIVDYPDGTQAVTQAKADAAGHYSSTLTIPAKISGVVHVLVDSGGTIAKATFTVS